MEVFGLILIGVSVALFFVRKHQASKALSIKSARPVCVAELKQIAHEVATEIGGGSWRDYVKVYGTIECDRPLTSELKQLPCVYYTMSVKRSYETIETRKDENGKLVRNVQRRSETLASNRQSVPFVLKDRNGDKVAVHPDGAAIETVKVLSDFQPERPHQGMISYGSFSRTVSRMSRPENKTLGYEYSESILPIDRPVLIVGMVSDATGDLVLQKPAASDQRYIISLKSDEELVAQADQSAKYASIGMIGCGGVGLILLLVGLVS